MSVGTAPCAWCGSREGRNRAAGSSAGHGPVLWAAQAWGWLCRSTMGSWFKLSITWHGLVQLYLTLLFLIFYLKSRKFAHKKAVLNKQTNKHDFSSKSQPPENQFTFSFTS